MKGMGILVTSCHSIPSKLVASWRMMRAVWSCNSWLVSLHAGVGPYIVSHLLVCVGLFGQKMSSSMRLYLWLTMPAQESRKLFDETGDCREPNNHPGISSGLA